MTSPPEFRCAFCGEGTDKRFAMITAPGGTGATGRPICICDVCVTDCQHIVTERIRADASKLTGEAGHG